MTDLINIFTPRYNQDTADIELLKKITYILEKEGARTANYLQVLLKVFMLSNLQPSQHLILPYYLLRKKILQKHVNMLLKLPGSDQDGVIPLYLLGKSVCIKQLYMQ